MNSITKKAQNTIVKQHGKRVWGPEKIKPQMTALNVDFLGFYTQTILSSAKRNSFISSLQICMLLLFIIA
jgi:hypothetical protein